MNSSIFSFSVSLDSARFPKLPEGFTSPVDDTPQRFVEQAERELSAFQEGVATVAGLDRNCTMEINGVSRTFSGGYRVTVSKASVHREVVIVFDAPNLGEPAVARQYQGGSDGKLYLLFIGQSEAEWFLCHLLQGLMPTQTLYL